MEKIWIRHDKYDQQVFDLRDLSNYLRSTAYPDLGFTDEEIYILFHYMDVDGDGSISKSEMVEFLRYMLERDESDPMVLQMEGK